ncbi:Tm-1-like ATP-binding domain-containing protein [Xenorhabdus sp. 42]|uniref:Tm-1-like ATP-binding domain-containing protein n=1 Tax=Xenorhabdus szentirmaii TaxID=290112 RepID=UPI0019A3DF74|nr:Tm-1-like ATP-binding domain-containing protein [Xenorhabdus sp. 42]MBD2821881.1 Tm-1-like ATP-binding domain-containing protein [Xenorhabdus sp. 42]
MNRFVGIVGTADTKLEELVWLKHCLRRAEVDSMIIDVSTLMLMDEQNKIIDISSLKVAEYSSGGVATVFCGDRGKAIASMSSALTNFLNKSINDIDGIIGIGGSGGTALITHAMQSLPIGLPKIMISTMASGNVSGYIGTSDIAMIYAVTDLCGLNRVSRSILSNAASMMAGAVKHTAPLIYIDKPALGLTMFGVTTPCINQITSNLNTQYDCLPFHATGHGGASMEKLVSDGELVAALDITLTEIADLLFDGVLSCPDTRLDVIAKKRIPWIGSTGALDMVNFGSKETIPERYKNRTFVEHNAQVTLMRTTPEENYQLGVWIGNKLNKCHGPIRFIIPEGGFSALDCPEQPFYLPAATLAFTDGLEKTVNQTEHRKIIKTPFHINSPEFCSLVVQHFEEIIQHQGIFNEALSSNNKRD